MPSTVLRPYRGSGCVRTSRAAAFSWFKSSRVKLTVCDLARDPAGGVEDSVAFTPTLVRRAPGPRTFILGHVTNPDLLMELLADCETEES